MVHTVNDLARQDVFADRNIGNTCFENEKTERWTGGLEVQTIALIQCDYVIVWTLHHRHPETQPLTINSSRTTIDYA